MNRHWGLGFVAALCLLSGALAQDRATKVRNDRARVEGAGFWIYNDLPKGLAEAKRMHKPLLVVFRCIPCENCAQLDERLVERDPMVQKLLEQFVCVRIVHANGMDLSLFQFDYDQSWAAFFMNADRTIYGRYGTRSHQTESQNDVSLEGFRKALQDALALDQIYPLNRASLLAKQGKPVEYKAPEEFPWLKGQYGPKLDYAGKVDRSCIHCHMVGEGQRLKFRTTGRPIPDEVIFPYPNPKVLGLVLDPKKNTRVAIVANGSSAERDGFRVNDQIVMLERQAILSVADIQWVLHHAGPSGSLKAQVRRGGQLLSLPLTLPPGWRQRDNLSWRATSWDVRRMVLGGMLLEELPDEARSQAGIADGSLALRVKMLGEYSPHDVALKAGIQRNDVLVAVAGKTEPATESTLMARLLKETRPGDQVTFTVLREGKKLDLPLKMQ